MNETIDNPRAEIDAIDIELLGLLNRRAAIALRAGEVKTRVDISLCDHQREREVITRLRQQNTGPLDDQNVASIFQRVMDECLHLQQRVLRKKTTEEKRKMGSTPAEFANGARVALLLGEHGTLSEEAVLAVLGNDCKTVSCPTFENLFAAIEDKRAEYILAPLENSLVGSIHRCYDLLLEKSLSIIAEIILPISHFLIGCPGASLTNIKSVESHSVVLAQCERFFAAHPHLKRVAINDPVSSIRRIIESGDLSKAVIGGKRHADFYGGEILQGHLEDFSENYTRFCLLALHPHESAQNHKISLVVRLAHRPGALHEALRPFVRRGIDLLKIESRPIIGLPWQYNFYLDLQTPASESELRGALEEVTAEAEEVRFLGRYSLIEVPNNELTVKN